VPCRAVSLILKRQCGRYLRADLITISFCTAFNGFEEERVPTRGSFPYVLDILPTVSESP